MGHGDGDVRGVHHSFAPNRPEIEQTPRDLLRITGCVEKRNAFEDFQTSPGNGRIAPTAFCAY